MEVPLGNFTVNQFASTLWLSIGIHKPDISFTYQSTAPPSSFLHDIVASRAPKRPRKSKARLVLRRLAVIFHLPPPLRATAENFPSRLWSLSFRSLAGCAGSDICFHLPLLFVAFSEWDESRRVLWFCHNTLAWLRMSLCWVVGWSAKSSESPREKKGHNLTLWSERCII